MTRLEDAMSTYAAYHQDTRNNATRFAVLFIGGWSLQLVGHAFEGRKLRLSSCERRAP